MIFPEHGTTAPRQNGPALRHKEVTGKSHIGFAAFSQRQYRAGPIHLPIKDELKVQIPVLNSVHAKE